MRKPQVKSQDITLTVPTLHAGQLRVLRESKRENFISAGRGWWKTGLFSHIARESFLANKGVIYSGPVHDQPRLAWARITSCLEPLLLRGYISLNKTENVIEGNCGPLANAWIKFVSLEIPDNARGSSPDVAIIDEAGLVKDEAAWYEVFRGYKTHRPQIVYWVGGTPKGRNWFWREWEACRGRDYAASWQIPNVGCRVTKEGLVRDPNPYENPHIPWETMLELYKSCPQMTFDQEYLAQFLDESGAVFRGVDEVVMPGLHAQPYMEAYHYQMGVDFGRVNDWTVVSVVRLPDMVQVYHDRFNTIAWERQIPLVVKAAQDYHASVWLDATGGSVGDVLQKPIIQQLSAQGIAVNPFKYSYSSKQDLMDNLAMLIEQGGITLMDVPEQTAELKAYQYTTGAGGKPIMSAPRGLHDDCVNGLALSVYKQKANPFVPEGSIYTDDEAEEFVRSLTESLSSPFAVNEHASSVW